MSDTDRVREYRRYAALVRQQAEAESIPRKRKELELLCVHYECVAEMYE